MKNKLISLLLIVTLFACFASVLFACGSSNTDTYEIALITDKGNIDDRSFNQGSWEGVEAFAKETGKSYKYYKPQQANDEGYLAEIDNAIENGAKVIVTPGFLFEVPVFTAQTKYPDVKFILLDGAPHDTSYNYKTEPNVASVMYAEEESGYLVGYAAVKDGYKNIGFMGGMSVPAVVAFGVGYLQGAETAAKELDVTVNAKYHYTGNFEENDTNKATAKTMYESGTEVIFACGGSVGKSVLAASDETGKKMIGVDVDQRFDSPNVITSATKGLKSSVYQVLQSIYIKGDFDSVYGGRTFYFDSTNGGVGIPTTVMNDEQGNAFDRFNTFNKEQYDAVYATLKDLDIVRTIKVSDTSTGATAEEMTKQLGLSKVKLTLVK